MGILGEMRGAHSVSLPSLCLSPGAEAAGLPWQAVVGEEGPGPGALEGPEECPCRHHRHPERESGSSATVLHTSEAHIAPALWECTLRVHVVYAELHQEGATHPGDVPRGNIVIVLSFIVGLVISHLQRLL